MFHQLLNTVWGQEEDFAAAKAAVEADDRTAIEVVLTTLRQKVETTDASQFPYALKYDAWLREFEAKIAVLEAFLADDDESWEKAKNAYQGLGSALDRLAESCDHVESIAKISFETDAAQARSLAEVCGNKGLAIEKNTLTASAAYDLIKEIGPKLGYEHTSAAVFPEGHKDVAVVKHTAENGSDYGYDVIYVVWKTADGEIHYREMMNTRSTKDYLNIRSLRIEEESLLVDCGSNGSKSVRLSDLEIE